MSENLSRDNYTPKLPTTENVLQYIAHDMYACYMRSEGYSTDRMAPAWSFIPDNLKEKFMNNATMAIYNWIDREYAAHKQFNKDAAKASESNKWPTDKL